MKLFARLHAVVVLSIVAGLYTLWSLPALHPIARAKKVWTRSSTHLVVFGDSWSNSKQSYDAEKKEQGSWSFYWSSTQQTLWTDILCSEVVCDRLLNFAQSFPSQPIHQRGPVVDEFLFANATRSLNLTLKPDNIPDLKAQVDQFLSGDVSDDKSLSESAKRGQTVFTAFFGLWEIWMFVELTDSEAEMAISESVGSLFIELNRLAKSRSTHRTRPIIILPKVPDPTWFPRWFIERTSSSDQYGQLQRRAVILTEEWNRLLDIHAQNVTKADMILPDFNQWILDLMRESDEAADAQGLASRLFGKYTGGQPTFTELRQPCVNYTAFPEGGLASLQSPAVCSDASRHLFWFVKQVPYTLLTFERYSFPLLRLIIGVLEKYDWTKHFSMPCISLSVLEINVRMWDDTHLSNAAHEVLGKNVFRLLQNQTESTQRPLSAGQSQDS